MKDFILVCPKTAVAYNEVFRLFKNATANFGYSRPVFNGLQGLCRWLTTYYVEKPLLVATGHANERYDNYPAINADRIKDIPRTKEKIGVPITIFDYDLKNYNIIGILKGKYSKIDGEYIVGLQGVVNGKDKFTRIVIQEKG